MTITPGLRQPEEPLIANFDELDQLLQDDKSDPKANPKDIAEYSADMLSELRDLASGSGFTFLAYLIQVAVEEAKIQADEHRHSKRLA